jgi:hypothetical protein
MRHYNIENEEQEEFNKNVWNRLKPYKVAVFV